jgi:UDP-glucuronate decarboxylase
MKKYSLGKRDLVTRGAEFLGSHLYERLLDNANEVLCVDDSFTGSRRNIEHLVKNKCFELLRHDTDPR